MYAARAICTYGGKEVPFSEADESVLHFATVACEEDSACARSIAYAENVPLFEPRAKRAAGEGVVVRFIARRMISDREATMAGQTEGRIRFCSQTDRHSCGLGQIKHFDLPVVDFVELWQGKVGLHARRGSRIWKKGDLCASMNKERVKCFVVRIKRPGRNAFLLNRKKLGKSYIRWKRIGGVLELKL